MAFKDSPCTRNCPDRDYQYCKTCEKQKEYKDKRFKEYQENVDKKAFCEYLKRRDTKIRRKEQVKGKWPR